MLESAALVALRYSRGHLYEWGFENVNGETTVEGYMLDYFMGSSVDVLETLKFISSQRGLKIRAWVYNIDLNYPVHSLGNVFCTVAIHNEMIQVED